MPVPLPPPPAGPTRLPPPPNDPPTLVDIANSVTYNKNISISCDAGVATQNDVGAGAVYQAALIAHNAGDEVAPLWFAPAITAALNAALAPILFSTTTTYNLLTGDGRVRPFKVVPFLDGTMPTAAPHNLPAIINIDIINALTGPQCTSYLNGYGVPVPNTLVDRKRAIKIQIGCTVV